MKVVDDDVGVLRTRKRAQGLLDAGIEDSLSIRQDLTRLWSMKERRITSPFTRKRRIVDVFDDDDDTPSLLPLSPLLESDPSQRETSSISSSSSRHRHRHQSRSQAPTESRFETNFSWLVSVYTAKADNIEADRERVEVRSQLEGLEKGLAEARRRRKRKRKRKKLTCSYVV